MNFSKLKTISRNMFVNILRITVIALISIVLTLVIACSQGGNKSKPTIKKTFEDKTDFRLSDGTRVYMNKNSELSFIQDFDKLTREVTLKRGEAYFEVARNQDLTFMVHTPEGGRIQVLGTAFDVDTQDEGKTVVRVKMGEVAFISPNNIFGHVFVKKNEMGTLTENNITKAENDRPNYLSWQSGILTFINAPIEEVVRDLSEHYNTTIVLKDNTQEYDKLTTLINNETLNDVLEKLKLLLNISYSKIDGGIIIFKED